MVGHARDGIGSQLAGIGVRQAGKNEEGGGVWDKVGQRVRTQEAAHVLVQHSKCFWVSDPGGNRCAVGANL